MGLKSGGWILNKEGVQASDVKLKPRPLNSSHGFGSSVARMILIKGCVSDEEGLSSAFLLLRRPQGPSSVLFMLMEGSIKEVKCRAEVGLGVHLLLVLGASKFLIL